MLHRSCMSWMACMSWKYVIFVLYANKDNNTSTHKVPPSGIHFRSICLQTPSKPLSWMDPTHSGGGGGPGGRGTASYIWMFPKMVVPTPKSSILIGFSIINHPFWGTSIFGNTHICICHVIFAFLRYCRDSVFALSWKPASTNIQINQSHDARMCWSCLMLASHG